MTIITPVLLAGGSGTRLWPLSRKSYPKQFSNLLGDRTLFQQCASRLLSSKSISFAPHIILTNSDFRFLVIEQLKMIGLKAARVLIEPEAKNTGPAILAASLFAITNDPEAVILAAPSDHVIADIDDFHEAISIGLNQLQNKKMVAFGIRPTHPETGYGYMELLQDSLDAVGTSTVSRFVEKPNIFHAEQMFKTGGFLWNSGIFLFKASDMVNAFRTLAPKTLKLALDAVDAATEDLSFLRLNPRAWKKLEDISIDYAIMEKIPNLVAVPYSSKWSDLGGWDAVWSETPKDLSDNAVSQGAYAIDCSNTLLRSESSNQKIVGLGLEDIVAVAMPDAVLVASKNKAQDVKKAVDLLRVNNEPQADAFTKDHRPWGWFESLALGDRFQVKRICVNPGGILSLQSHKHRSEHWTVVEGTAKVTIDEKVKMVNEGESVYVPKGAIHRMENLGKATMVLIEVQIGTYLGEDDIVRYEDIYARN